MGLWKTLTYLLLAGVGLVSLSSDAWGQTARSKFYDFSETTIRAEQKIPGLSMILGEAYGRSHCPNLGVDAFRRCIGEVRDLFRYVTPGGQVPIDVVVVPVGRGALERVGEAARALVKAVDIEGADVRLILVAGEQAGGPRSKLRRKKSFVTVKRRSRVRAVRWLEERSRRLASGGVVPPGLGEVARLGGAVGRKGNPLRPEAFQAVIVVATQPDPWRDLRGFVRSLNDARGPAGWTASVACLDGVCGGFKTLVRRFGKETMKMSGASDIARAGREAVESALWWVNRWTLSQSPGMSGHLELRAAGAVAARELYAYDPFERRIRLSDRRLPVGNDKSVEAWYFPFDARQVLLEVCPEALIREGRQGQEAVAKCRGWMADEVAALSPPLSIDVAFPAVGKGLGQSQREQVFAAMTAFRKPFASRGIDLSLRQADRTVRWREGALRVELHGKGARPLSDSHDLTMPWSGQWDSEVMERLAWRVISRSIRIEITGMPIIYDTLHVFLNGRQIGHSKGDGAGYIMRDGALSLDVAAPLHPQSHIFLVYKADR